MTNPNPVAPKTDTPATQDESISIPMTHYRQLLEDVSAAQEARKHTHEWCAAHYGKLQDWARTRLPEQWVNEFFSCIANGTWGHADVGKRYTCVAGFDVVPSNYFKMETAQEQILHDQYVRAEQAESTLAAERVSRVQAEEALKAAGRLRHPKYIDWQKAGGPNECKHGYAAGIPCRTCDEITLDSALSKPSVSPEQEKP